MIPFDFDYYKPSTIDETLNLSKELKTKGVKSMYYGGGTEFITMSRMNNIYADAVIDIKGIPECNIYEIRGDELVIGAGLTLTQISEVNLFPLLSKTIKRIADHTVQGKLTLGGNLMGSIIYRESALPLLVSNSDIIIGNVDGIRRESFVEYWDKEIEDKEGDLIIQVIVKTKYLHQPYVHVKRTKNEKIDYPVISIVALKDKGKINIGFSGLCGRTFRSYEMEEALNDNSILDNTGIYSTIERIPYKILDDIYGSAEYRKFLLSRMLLEIVDEFREEV